MEYAGWSLWCLNGRREEVESSVEMFGIPPEPAPLSAKVKFLALFTRDQIIKTKLSVHDNEICSEARSTSYTTTDYIPPPRTDHGDQHDS